METLLLLTPLAWRNLWRNSKRTVITLIVVSAGVYSVLFMASFIQAWADSTREQALNTLTGNGQIHAQGFLDDPTVNHLVPPLSDQTLAILNNEPVTGWTRRIRVPAVVQSEYRTLPLTLMGVEPAREAAISIIPAGLVEGQYLNAPDDIGIFIGKSLADRLKTRLEKRIIIMAQTQNGTLAERSFTVTGIFDGNKGIEDQYAFAGLETTQQMLEVGQSTSEIVFRLAGEEGLETLVASLKDAAPDLDTRAWRDLSPMAAIIESTMSLTIYIWLSIMFILMAFGILNTQLMAVFERVREFGLLQALGMRPRHILLIVALESFFLVGVGVLLGNVATVLTILSLSNGIDISFLAEGAAMAGAGSMMYPRMNVPQMIEMSLLIWILSILVALWPARKASKSSPVEAMTHVS